MFPVAEPTSGATVDAPAEKPVRVPFSDQFLNRYRAFCYRRLGAWFDRRYPSEELAEHLKQAGVNASPGMHRSVLVVTSLLAVLGAGLVALLLFGVLLHVPNGLLFVGPIAAVSGGATAAAFQSLISTRTVNRKEQLERELPFTLSELSVLASTGMSPIALVRRMAARSHDPAMTAEFKKVVYKADLQGKDLITALAETAKESASNSLREALWDLASMIHQGGNLDEYLRSKSDDVLKLRRSIQKEFVERLTTFVDIYVSLVLIGVLMIGVGSFLLDAFGSTILGLNANDLLLLLTYGIVPLAVVVTAIMISMAYARIE